MEWIPKHKTSLGLKQEIRNKKKGIRKETEWVPIFVAMAFVIGRDVIPPAHTREPYGTLTIAAGSVDILTIPSIDTLGGDFTFITTYSAVISVTALPHWILTPLSLSTECAYLIILASNAPNILSEASIRLTFTLLDNWGKYLETSSLQIY